MFDPPAPADAFVTAREAVIAVIGLLILVGLWFLSRSSRTGAVMMKDPTIEKSIVFVVDDDDTYCGVVG